MDSKTLEDFAVALLKQFDARKLKKIAKDNKLQSSGNKDRVAQNIFDATKGYSITATQAANVIEFTVKLTLNP